MSKFLRVEYFWFSNWTQAQSEIRKSLESNKAPAFVDLITFNSNRFVLIAAQPTPHNTEIPSNQIYQLNKHWWSKLYHRHVETVRHEAFFFWQKNVRPLIVLTLFVASWQKQWKRKELKALWSTWTQSNTCSATIRVRFGCKNLRWDTICWTESFLVGCKIKMKKLPLKKYAKPN